jgi:hypothetical protein
MQDKVRRVVDDWTRLLDDPWSNAGIELRVRLHCSFSFKKRLDNVTLVKLSIKAGPDPLV